MRLFNSGLSIVRIATSVIAFCVTGSAATAATPVATTTIDIGVASTADALIQSQYFTSRNADDTRRARRNAVRLGIQGRYDFDEAIAYLKRSPRAAVLIARLDKAHGMLIVTINNTCNDSQSIGMGWKSIVSWDPHCAFRTLRGTDSPSLVLLHELVHTLHLFEDPEKFINAGSHRNKDFDDDEERRTILFGEVPVARELGELVRGNHHDGKAFTVNDPTLR